MFDQEEIDRLLAAEEVRLRSLWKHDFQAGLRAERTVLLDHVEFVIKAEIENARAAIVSDLRKQLDEFRAQIQKQSDAAVAYRQKTLGEVLGLSANMEERLREHILVFIDETVRKVLNDQK